MSRTLYQYNVTLTLLDEDDEIERTIRATSVNNAKKEFKELMFDQDFWKSKDYVLKAKIKPIKWNK